MARVRSKRAHERRSDWPLSVEDELRAGVDPAAFRSALARIFASQAARWWAAGDHEDALLRLQRAREHEALARRVRPELAR